MRTGLVTGFILLSIFLIASALADENSKLKWEENGHYYEIANGNLSWNDARSYAETQQFTDPGTGLVYKGHLATITSPEENSWIVQNIISRLNGTTYDIWLGGYRDEGFVGKPSEGWHWITGELWTWTNWNPGKPDNYSSYDERFLEIRDYQGFWSDENSQGSKHADRSMLIEYEPTTGQTISKEVSSTPGNFIDPLTKENPEFWNKSDGHCNKKPFFNIWCANHVTLSNEGMDITLNDNPCQCKEHCEDCETQKYASGEIRTNCSYGFGRLEASIKAPKAEGTVTALFTYADPSKSGKQDEIDIELLGKDTTGMQANYWTNGIQHPYWINLKDKLKDPQFDTSNKFHKYRFIWNEKTIRWYVDDVQVCEIPDEKYTDLPPKTPGQIIMSLWAWKDFCLPLDCWAGNFEYSNPVHAYFKDIRYISN